MRGGNHNDGLAAGVFTFNQDNGRIRAWISFRVDFTMLKERKYKFKEFKKSIMA